MSILRADQLSLTFGDFDLFHGISISIANDSKIGLIGPNGIGKTSLLLILAGLRAPTTGKVHLAGGKRLGYLRQEAVEAFGDRENSVYTEMLTVFEGLREMQDQLHEFERRMAAGEWSDELLAEYGERQHAFEAAGGYDFEVQIQRTLNGLGLGKDDWDKPLNQLSGGEKTRALLARLLLEKPDLLMLDEPTNHLDIEAVEWLERILREWEGAVLIVSHDRYFLDATVHTILEMTVDGIEEYSGNYSAYLLQRQERWELRERVYREEKERLLKEVDFIQRNWVRASTHARALGLLRRISRDLALVDEHGIMALRSGKQWSEWGLSVERPLDVIEAIRKVNAISMRNPRPHAIRPRLPSAPQSGTIVLRSKGALIGYPGNPLFETGTFELRRGECVALIGPNGSGKTTFLKVLMEQIEPLQGEVQKGASLKIGYFAQAHDSLQGERTVLDELLRHKEMREGAARSYLAPYLFRGEDVFKPLVALSGGERARLALAILALDGANFLVLDEPTNHLDIPAREALQEVMENFDGTILLVSHDRYLIDRLATQIWELKGSRLNIFKGTYREYVLRQEVRPENSLGRQKLLIQRPLMHGSDRETKRRALELEQLETRIREQETAIQRLSSDLRKAGEAKSYDKSHQLSWQMAQAQATLDRLMNEWEKLVA
jgi:ATP-binding cassette subfamily F protein 3